MDVAFLYLLIEEALELFDESFVPNRNFSSSINYEGCLITASGSNNFFSLAFDCKNSSAEYSFDSEEELDSELILDSIQEQF